MPSIEENRAHWDEYGKEDAGDEVTHFKFLSELYGRA